jgi:hypothetical protein
LIGNWFFFDSRLLNLVKQELTDLAWLALFAHDLSILTVHGPEQGVYEADFHDGCD